VRVIYWKERQTSKAHRLSFVADDQQSRADGVCLWRHEPKNTSQSEDVQSHRLQQAVAAVAAACSVP
jgi:hypothetical protein